MKRQYEKTILRTVCTLAFLMIGAAMPLSALDSSVKVFIEPGFPATDTAAISEADLHTLIP